MVCAAGKELIELVTKYKSRTYDEELTACENLGGKCFLLGGYSDGAVKLTAPGSSALISAVTKCTILVRNRSRRHQ